MKKGYIRDLYLSKAWYLTMTGLVVLFFCSFFFDILFEVALVLSAALLLLTIADYCLLFMVRGTVRAVRIIAPRLSLGDENTVSLSIYNSLPFAITGHIIDELPEQFQERDFKREIAVPYTSKASVTYTLRPVERGEYLFGHVLCFIKSPLKLLQRRISSAEEMTIKVYPSYLQLKKYQLLAVSDNPVTGTRKIRRLGHSMEFEKIKDYVLGDDVRSINWKATARRGGIMVNTYTDAREQQVYCVIDKGRAMKMPFDGMTLLDHSINAALALLNVALLKHDKAGLVTFTGKQHGIIAADRRSGQITHLLEALYKQKTSFQESDYEHLWVNIYRCITQRSCIILFTNFETYSSLERQLPYLKQMAARHLVCVVFFQNTMLKELHESVTETTEGIYIKTIAAQFDFEKKQIVKELRRHGILSVLTTPAGLTMDVINKYLELKAKQMI